MQEAEPKGTDFLLPTEVQDNLPSTNQVKLTVRSDEARQSSQVDGISLNPTFYHSLRMSLLPTPEEKTLDDNFKTYCIYKHYEFQKPIQTSQNTYIADFCIEKYKLIIEIDGLSHLRKLNYDIIRDKELGNLGYRIIHFSNKEVRDSIFHCFKRINQIIQILHFFHRWNGIFQQRYNSLKKKYEYHIEIEKNYINGRSKIKDIINQYIEKIKRSSWSNTHFMIFRKRITSKSYTQQLLLEPHLIKR